MKTDEQKIHRKDAEVAEKRETADGRGCRRMGREEYTEERRKPCVSETQGLEGVSIPSALGSAPV